MIEGFQLLRNIGQFDSVNPITATAFSPFSFLYAENGRGKTTISTILRSLASGDVTLVLDRQRLGSQHPPHIVINYNGRQIIFKNGAWSETIPNIAIFDDGFVAENVCSGIELGSSHKQKLHELILGAQGVALNRELQIHVSRIEQHNVNLKTKGEAIPASALGPLTANAFCAQKPDPDIDTKLKEAERRLAAAKSAEAIRQQSGFHPIDLPDFDLDSIKYVLDLSLTDLEADAVARVSEHVKSIGKSGEAWVADGMGLIKGASEKRSEEICPFCAQDLRGSDLIRHYRLFFSDAYSELKQKIRATGIEIRDTHDGDVPAAFERSVRTAVQKQEFWKSFTKIPDLNLDTAAIARDWKLAREAVLQQLRDKASAPLEVMSLKKDTLDAISTYRKRIEEVKNLSEPLIETNASIDIVKEQAAADDLGALIGDLAKQRAKKSRFETNIAPLCDAYIAEKNAKRETEKKRNETREKLDVYRNQIFPAYEEKINEYLGKFNAAFRIGKVESVNNRGGSSASYCIVINQQEVNITADNGPSFKNTLSAGDRNTLALAFFFASIENTPDLAQRIVVIDDPMTSLDEHRSLKTVQEVRLLQKRVAQTIVLSHSKPFLCNLWNGADTNVRTAIRISRAAIGSEFAEWDVRNDSITEHDKRHELVSRFIVASDPNKERQAAEALRPILEAFMRIAYPKDFPPGVLLGPFIGVCNQRLAGSDEILSRDDTIELRALLDYANKFHHDSNRAWETETINDTELLDFARRTLLFASRR